MSEESVLAMVERGFRRMASLRPGRELPPLRPETSLDQLGIDSIEFIEAVSYVEDELGHMLPSERLTATQTIGELVQLVLSECGGVASGSLTPG